MDRPLHTGYLSKRGRFNKEWKRRFFVLLSDRLLYAKDPAMKSPEHIILTKVVLEELVSSDPDYAPAGTSWALRHPSERVYKLKADTASDAWQWKEALFEVCRTGMTLVGNATAAIMAMAATTTTTATAGITTTLALTPTHGGTKPAAASAVASAAAKPNANGSAATMPVIDPFSSVSISAIVATAKHGSALTAAAAGAAGYAIPRSVVPAYKDDPARYTALLPEKPTAGSLTENLTLAGRNVDTNAVYFPTRIGAATPTTGSAPPQSPAAASNPSAGKSPSVNSAATPRGVKSPAAGDTKTPIATTPTARRPVSYTTFDSPNTGSSAGARAGTSAANALASGGVQRFDWHNRFARIWTLPNGEERCRRWRELTNEFTIECRAGAVALLTTNHAAGADALANSDRLTHNGIAYRFARHEAGGMFGTDEKAMKSAAHELRARQAIMTADLSGLRAPLMAVIEYRGHRFVCTPANTPFSSRTLVYGSRDRGETIHTGAQPSLASNASNAASPPLTSSTADARLQSLVEECALRLNLKRHTAGKAKVDIYFGVDVEVHRVYETIDADAASANANAGDRKGGDFEAAAASVIPSAGAPTAVYYVMDAARLFPPEYPVRASDRETLTVGDIVSKQLRPELVRSNDVPLSSDACSGFGIANGTVHNEEVRRATMRLFDDLIPAFACALDARRIPVLHGSDLSYHLHRYGIGCRHLGYVRSVSRDAATRLFLLTEISIRAAKLALRTALRTATAATAAAGGGSAGGGAAANNSGHVNSSDACREVTRRFLNELCGAPASTGSFQFWVRWMYPRIVSHFPNALNRRESHALARTFQTVPRYALLHGVCQVMGIALDADIEHRLWSNAPRSFETLTPLGTSTAGDAAVLQFVPIVSSELDPFAHIWTPLQTRAEQLLVDRELQSSLCAYSTLVKSCALMFGARSLSAAHYQSRLAYCQLLTGGSPVQALANAQSAFALFSGILGARDVRTIDSLVVLARCHLQIARLAASNALSSAAATATDFTMLCAGPTPDRVSCARAIQLLRHARTGVAAAYPFYSRVSDVTAFLGVALNLIGQTREAQSCLLQAEKLAALTFGSQSKEVARVLSLSDVGSAIRRSGDPADATPSSVERLERATTIMRQCIQKCGRRVPPSAAIADPNAAAVDSKSDSAAPQPAAASQPLLSGSVWDAFTCEDHHTLLALAEYSHRIKRVAPDPAELQSFSVTLNETNVPIDNQLISLVQTTLDIPKRVPAVHLSISLYEAALRVCASHHTPRATLDLLTVYINALAPQRVFEWLAAIETAQQAATAALTRPASADSAVRTKAQPSAPAPVAGIAACRGMNLVFDTMHILASLQYGDEHRARERVNALRSRHSHSAGSGEYLDPQLLVSYCWVIAVEARRVSCKAVEIDALGAAISQLNDLLAAALASDAASAVASGDVKSPVSVAAGSLSVSSPSSNATAHVCASKRVMLIGRACQAAIEFGSAPLTERFLNELCRGEPYHADTIAVYWPSPAAFYSFTANLFVSAGLRWFSCALRHFEWAYEHAEHSARTAAPLLHARAMARLYAPLTADGSVGDTKTAVAPSSGPIPLPANVLILDSHICLIACIVAALTDGGRALNVAGVWSQRAKAQRAIEIANTPPPTANAATSEAEATEQAAKEEFFRLCVDYVADLSARHAAGSIVLDAPTTKFDAKSPVSYWPNVPEYVSSLLFLEQCAIFFAQALGEGRLLLECRHPILAAAERVLQLQKKAGRRMNERGELFQTPVHPSADSVVLGTVDGIAADTKVSPAAGGDVPSTASADAKHKPVSTGSNSGGAALAADEEEDAGNSDIVVENIRLLLGSVTPTPERWDYVYAHTLKYAALARYKIGVASSSGGGSGGGDSRNALNGDDLDLGSVMATTPDGANDAVRFPPVTVSLAGQALEVPAAVLNGMLKPPQLAVATSTGGEFDDRDIRFFGASNALWRSARDIPREIADRLTALGLYPLQSYVSFIDDQTREIGIAHHARWDRIGWRAGDWQFGSFVADEVLDEQRVSELNLLMLPPPLPPAQPPRGAASSGDDWDARIDPTVRAAMEQRVNRIRSLIDENKSYLAAGVTATDPRLIQHIDMALPWMVPAVDDDQASSAARLQLPPSVFISLYRALAEQRVLFEPVSPWMRAYYRVMCGIHSVFIHPNSGTGMASARSSDSKSGGGGGGGGGRGSGSDLSGSSAAPIDRNLVALMLSVSRAGLEINRALRPLSLPDEVRFRIAVIGCLASDHTSNDAKVAASDELVRFEKMMETTASAAANLSSTDPAMDEKGALASTPSAPPFAIEYCMALFWVALQAAAHNENTRALATIRKAIAIHMRVGAPLSAEQLQRRVTYLSWAAKLTPGVHDQVKYYSLALETSLDRLAVVAASPAQPFASTATPTSPTAAASSGGSAIADISPPAILEVDIERACHYYKQMLIGCMHYAGHKWLLTVDSVRVAAPYNKFATPPKPGDDPTSGEVRVPIRALAKRIETFARDFPSTGLHRRLALLHAELASSLLDRISKSETAKGETEVLAHADIALGLSYPQFSGAEPNWHLSLSCGLTLAKLNSPHVRVRQHAIELLRDALALEPGASKDAMPFLLRLYRSVSRCAEGAIFLQTVLPKLSASDQTDVLHNLACMCAVGGEHRAAVSLFDSAVVVRPAPELLVEYAQYCYSTGEYRRAIELLQHPVLAFLLKPLNQSSTAHGGSDSKYDSKSIAGSSGPGAGGGGSSTPGLSERLSHEILCYDNNDSSLLIPALRAFVTPSVLAALNRSSSGIDGLYVGVRVLGLTVLAFSCVKAAAADTNAASATAASTKAASPRSAAAAKKTAAAPAAVSKNGNAALAAAVAAATAAGDTSSATTTSAPPKAMSRSAYKALAKSAVTALEQWVVHLFQQSALAATAASGTAAHSSGPNSPKSRAGGGTSAPRGSVVSRAPTIHELAEAPGAAGTTTDATSLALLAGTDPAKEALLLVVSRYLLGMSYYECGLVKSAEEYLSVLVEGATANAVASAVPHSKRLLLPAELFTAIAATIHTRFTRGTF